MREIKFRAWDKWCEISEDNPTSMVEETHRVMVKLNGDVYNSEYGDDQNDRYVLMQYTGLKDKNGVEIYEGDIVEYGISNSNVFYAECIFENAKFQWKIHDTDYTYNDYDILAEDEGNWIEIIGNIYENPELLENSND